MECVRCGAPSGDLVLCRDCFLRGRDLIVAPLQVAILRCPRCSAFSDRGNRWLDRPEEAVWPVLRGDVSVPAELEGVDLSLEVSIDGTGEGVREGVVRLHLEAEYGAEHVSADREVRLRIRPMTCLACSRRAGTYYEAIVQIRGERDVPPADVDEALETFLGIVGDAAVNRVERTRGGHDIYLIDKDASRNAAHELAGRYGTRVVESRSHGGFRDGKELFRLTLLVRLPLFRPGSVVDHRGHPSLITSVGPRVHVLDLVNGRRSAQPLKDFGSPTVLASPEERRPTVVVSADRSGVVILDPATQRAVTVLTPFAVGAGQEIEVVRIGDGILVLPPEREGNAPPDVPVGRAATPARRRRRR